MISVILPVYNEEGVIGTTVKYLKSITADCAVEIIVVDGGSTDHSAEEARREGATVIQSEHKGRAAQMNTGARASRGTILYFLHADSRPPRTMYDDILHAVSQGFPAGCYRLRFDVDHWFLKANTWFTRFDINAFRYGDQSLFVKRKLFDEIGGFCEHLIVMEDNEIIKRLRKHARFVILPRDVVTSARKYVDNGIFRMQGTFYLIYLLYHLGCPQQSLLRLYRRIVRQGKL
jgi:rSAM/selenodomain-associated transferase 2